MDRIEATSLLSILVLEEQFCIKVLLVSSDVWNSVHFLFHFDVSYVASSSLPPLSAHSISVLQGKESNSALWVLIELNSCFCQVSRVRLSEDVSLFDSLSLWLCTSHLPFRLLELHNSFPILWNVASSDSLLEILKIHMLMELLVKCHQSRDSFVTYVKEISSN